MQDHHYMPTIRIGKRSILLTAICGVAAGLLVVLFSDMPHGDLWSFSSFSSATLGFWMFSTSTLALSSSQRLIGAVNGFVYVGTMFFVTGIYKEVRNFHGIYNQYTGAVDMLTRAIASAVLYAVIPAMICGVLAAVLWSGGGIVGLARYCCLLPRALSQPKQLLCTGMCSQRILCFFRRCSIPHVSQRTSLYSAGRSNKSRRSKNLHSHARFAFIPTLTHCREGMLGFHTRRAQRLKPLTGAAVISMLE